jgi:hypothetical protein
VSAAATVAAEKSRRVRGQQPADVLHAVASEPVLLGSVTCRPGEPLCGTQAPLQPCLSILLPSALTCHLCAALAARESVVIGGGDAG